MSSSTDALPMKILVIDDEAAVQSCLEKFLQGHGHHYFSAGSARDGIAKNKEEQPQLVLVEIDLGPKAELNLLSALTRDNPGASVVILTSNPTVPSAIEAMKFGASDYLQKPYLDAPVDLEKLKKLVAAHIVKAADQGI